MDISNIDIVDQMSLLQYVLIFYRMVLRLETR